MEDSGARNQKEPGCPGTARDTGVQTHSRGQGHVPRLSKSNLFTLLSLWMELFPREDTDQDHGQVNPVGVVVVREGKVLGLHSSSSDLHAGQSAVLQHGVNLSNCSLFFSRRPCATCLKMIINAGVSQICFWPGDPEISMLRSSTPSSNQNSNSHDASENSHDASEISHDASGPVSEEAVSEEAALDALASEKLKSNSRVQVCVPLRPLTPGLTQFVTETSRENDFMERVMEDEPGVDIQQLYNRERVRVLKRLSGQFLVRTSLQHQRLLTSMCLETFCVEPYFSSLRHNMEELIQLLSSVVSGLPLYKDYGFYRDPSSPPLQCPVRSEVTVHCMVQAQLLSFRTEDPKVGVGAVIWARGQSAGGGHMGALSLVGCGYNAYPSGSQFAEYPQMDDKQEDRQRRKYRYIIHAEQNALTFRSREIRAGDCTMLFVTKCPCDECVPLITASGVSHIFTSDQDKNRDKEDISYLRFSRLQGVSKYIWQRSPSQSPQSSAHFANGFVVKHSRPLDSEHRNAKKLKLLDANGDKTQSTTN